MKKKNDRKRHGFKIMALLFLGVLIVICLTNLITKDKSYSEKENRMLEQKPELSLSGVESGSFMERYETYQSDQFIGRDFWVSVKTNFELLLGKRESNGVFKGKKRYLMEDIAQPDEEQLAENVEAIREFGESYKEVPVHVMLVPNAANVLSDKLPRLAVTENQSRQFKEIRESLGSGIQWIDAQKALKSHKDEEIYYHTDHHWTTRGAYYAFQELAASMKLDTSKAPKLKPYAVTSDFNGTLSAISGYESGYREPIYIYAAEDTKDDVSVVVNYVEEQKKTATLYDRTKLKGKDKYAVFLGGNYGTIDIRTTADSTSRLLLVKDSYANCLIPFLIPYYREIIVIDPRYYYGDIHKIMKENKITDVLFLYNGNTFMEDNSIHGVLSDDKTE